MKDANYPKLTKTMLTALPLEIIDIIFQHADYPSLYYLKHASRFFAQNQKLNQEMSGFKLIESTRFVCGHENTFVLSGHGKLYACGNNQQGQLGLGHCVNRKELQQISLGDKKIAEISVSVDCTYLLSRDGQVYAAGLIENKIMPYFRHIPFPFEVKQIAVGLRHVLLLSAEGKLYGYGSNEQGQLGLPQTIKSIERGAVLDYQLLPNVRIKKIMANNESTVVEGFNRTLYVTGSNVNGKIGAGTHEYQYGFFSILQRLPFSQTGSIKQVSLSETNLLVLFKNGRLYGCGTDDDYELGGIADGRVSAEGNIDAWERLENLFVTELSELPLNFSADVKVEKILAGYKTNLFMLNNNIWYFYGLLNGCDLSYNATRLTLNQVLREKYIDQNKHRGDVQPTLADRAHNIFVYQKAVQFFGVLKPSGENQGQLESDNEYTSEPTLIMNLKKPYF